MLFFVAGLARRVREEAEKLGLSDDEYLVELLSQSLDSEDRAREYVEAALDLLGQVQEELKGETLGRLLRSCGVLPHLRLRLMHG